MGLAGNKSTRLREKFGFGSNPGNLRMLVYRPPSLAENPALVVVLHGCTQPRQTALKGKTHVKKRTHG
jgi:poly(3-hydroxybutyrate) depolymerase